MALAVEEVSFCSLDAANVDVVAAFLLASPLRLGVRYCSSFVVVRALLSV